jgi:CBS domain-containing protein
MATTVREIMDVDVVTVTRDADVETVIGLLHDHELPGLPVVDGDGRCVGIVTEADLIVPDEDGDLHLPHYISVFGGVVFLEPFKRFEDKLRKAFAASAEDMMSADPDTIEPDATVQEAARRIHDTGHNRLPVVEGDRLVGIVTRVDVLGSLAG